MSRKDEGDKLIVFERGDLVFVFNFHWNNSYTDYRIGCNKPGKYQVRDLTWDSHLQFFVLGAVKRAGYALLELQASAARSAVALQCAACLLMTYLWLKSRVFLLLVSGGAGL